MELPSLPSQMATVRISVLTLCSREYEEMGHLAAIAAVPATSAGSWTQECYCRKIPVLYTFVYWQKIVKRNMKLASLFH